MTLASVHSANALPSPLLSPEAREDLNRYAEAGGFTLRAETHPWYAAFASVARLDEARAASSVLAELRGHNVPDLRHAAERLADFPGLATPTTVRETATAISLLVRVRATLDVLRPEAYEAEADVLDALLAATATPAWRAERGVSQSWWQRTVLGRRARGLAAARATRRPELHGALAEAAATRAEWAALSADAPRPSLPRDPAFLDAAGPAAEAALTGLGQLTDLIGPDSPLEDLPFASLVDLLDRLAGDEGTLYRLPRLRELHDGLTAQGLGELLAQLTEQQADVTTTAAIIAQRTTPESDAEATALTPDDTSSPLAGAERTDAEPTTDADAALVDDHQATADEPENATVAEEGSSTVDAGPIADAEGPAEPANEAQLAADDDLEIPVTAQAGETGSPVTPEAESAAVGGPLAVAATEAEEDAAPIAAAAEADAAVADAGTGRVGVEVASQDEGETDAPDEAAMESSGAGTEAAAGRRAKRSKRPDVVAGRPVTAYSAEQLEALVRWIDADGVERSEEELLRAAMKELGFSRLGPRIKEALGAAVDAARG